MKCNLVNPNFKENYLKNILLHRGVAGQAIGRKKPPLPIPDQALIGNRHR
jgi:hypothetical protein